MLHTKVIRQGAMNIHIAPDGSIEKYEVSMAIPYNAGIETSGNARVVFSNKGGRRKYVVCEFKEHRSAMDFKLSLQLEITKYKQELLEARRDRLLNHLSTL